MDKVHVRPITCYERQQLHRMKRQLSNHVNSRHARIVLLSAGGVCNREIAQRVDCSPQWVRRIIHRFNQGGLEAISWYPYYQAAGSPRKFLAELVEQIVEVALFSPKALIGMTQWSLSKLREYLVSQKIVAYISLEWLRTLLKRCRIRWRRTKTWKESTDPEFWPKYRRIRRLYQRRPGSGRQICVDEFGPLNLQPRHGYCLAKAGAKRVERLRATYRRTSGVRHFLAAYDLETGTLLGRFHSRKTWIEFLRFLRWLRRRYPRSETLHIAMDNYSPHLKEEVWAWARANNVKFYLTPSHASWLNRIECQFVGLKKFALDNSDYQSHEEQEQAIRRYLAWRNSRRAIAVEPWRSSLRTNATSARRAAA